MAVTLFNPIPTQMDQLPPEAAIESKKGKVLTDAYLLNGGIIFFTTTLQSTLNQLLDNNSLSSICQDRSFTASIDNSFSHFNKKMLKGNWKKVDSQSKQLLVLVGYVASAFIMDFAAIYGLGKDNPGTKYGKTTAIAAANTVNYLSLMCIGKVLSKKTFKLGYESNKKDFSTAQKIGSATLVALGSSVSAVANRSFGLSKNSLETVISFSAHEIISQLFKMGKKVEKKTQATLKILFLYLLISVSSDVLVGMAIPNRLPLNNIEHYIGATTLGATALFGKTAFKCLMNSNDGEEMKPHKYELLELGSLPSKKLKSPKPNSTLRYLAALTISVVTPLLVILANRFDSIKSSSTASLSVKLLQHNVNGVALKELFKQANSTPKKLCTILIPPLIALGSELAANYFDPSESTSLPVTGVTVATAAGYLGMLASGSLFGKIEIDDE